MPASLSKAHSSHFSSFSLFNSLSSFTPRLQKAQTGVWIILESLLRKPDPSNDGGGGGGDYFLCITEAKRLCFGGRKYHATLKSGIILSDSFHTQMTPALRDKIVTWVYTDSCSHSPRHAPSVPKTYERPCLKNCWCRAALQCIQDTLWASLSRGIILMGPRHKV